jgi:hypothetical protein
LQQQALSVAEALRQAEAQALDGSGIQPTPIMISTSYDYELLQLGAIAGVNLNPDIQNKATAAISKFIAPFVLSINVDAISLEWLPRSVSAGDVDGFGPLLQGLSSAARGKQVVLTTGFSSAFHTEDEQHQFLGLTATNLADLRAVQGATPTFVGVIFREGLERGNSRRKPEPNISQWQWPQRAKELKDLWSAGKSSSEIKWWLSKTEAGLGLIRFTSGNTPSALPGLQVFQQIASSAQQAVQTVTASPVPLSSGAVHQSFSGTTQQYPGTPQYSGTSQDPYGSQAIPATANVPYPGANGTLGTGSSTGASAMPSPSGSYTQQMLFGIVNQFTTQMSAALASRIQSGRISPQNYAGGTNLNYPSGTNFGSGPPNHVPPSVDSGNAGTVPPTVYQPQDPSLPAGVSGTVSANPGPGATAAGTAYGESPFASSNGYPDPGIAASPGTGVPSSDGSGAAPDNTGTIKPRGMSALRVAPMPKITSFALMKDAMPSPLRGKRSAFVQRMVLQVTNPANTPTNPVQAELRMDKKTVSALNVPALLPKQSRSVVFEVPTGRGNHKLQVNMKGSGGTNDTATAAITTAPDGTVRASGSTVSSSLPGGNESSFVTGRVRSTLPGVRHAAISGLTTTKAAASVSPSAGKTTSNIAPNPTKNGESKVAPSFGPPRGVITMPSRAGVGTAPAKTGHIVSSTPGKQPAEAVGLVRPNLRIKGSAVANKTTVAGSAGSSITPRPVSGTMTTNSAASGSRLGVAATRHGGSPGVAGRAATNSAATTNSLSPTRPGSAVNNPVVNNKTAVPQSRVASAAPLTMKSASAASTKVNNANCVAPPQVDQRKNTAACKPGQTANCATPSANECRETRH